MMPTQAHADAKTIEFAGSRIEIRKAPPLPPWPQGLPLTLETPSEAQCVDVDGVGLGEGLWLSIERSVAVADRLKMLVAYPARCQARIDALEGAHVAEINGIADVAMADAGLAAVKTEVERPTGHSTLEVVGWSTAAGVVGIVVGIIVGGTAVVLLLR